MRYAKLINGLPDYASNPILNGENYIGNPPTEIYAQHGYKPVTYNDQPPPQGVGWYMEVWTETADAIVQGWSWHEATDEDEISDAEALDMLLGGEGG